MDIRRGHCTKNPSELRAVAGNLRPHREEPVMFSCLVFSSLAFFFIS